MRSVLDVECEFVFVLMLVFAFAFRVRRVFKPRRERIHVCQPATGHLTDGAQPRDEGFQAFASEMNERGREKPGGGARSPRPRQITDHAPRDAFSWP